MTTPTQARWRAALSTRLMTDDERASTLSGIQKVAPQGSLFGIPAVAASYGALSTKGATLAAAAGKAAADEKVYLLSVSERDLARIAFDRELDTYKTLVENNAQTGGDVTSMGLVLFAGVVVSRTPPEPPAALVVKIGSAHGKARVIVAGKGDLGSFVAEMCTDPGGQGPWTPLPGTGKQRKLALPSGTKVWVHFAKVRFGMQSAWSVPVLVTMP